MLLPTDLMENLEETRSSYPCRAIAALLASLDAQDNVLMRLVSTFGRCDDCISSFPRHLKCLLQAELQTLAKARCHLHPSERGLLVAL